MRRLFEGGVYSWKYDICNLGNSFVNSIGVSSLCFTFLTPVFSPVHRDTKKPRGFTFCQYRREEDAADAVRGMSGRVSQGLGLGESCEVVMSGRESPEGVGGGRE